MAQDRGLAKHDRPTCQPGFRQKNRLWPETPGVCFFCRLCWLPMARKAIRLRPRNSVPGDPGRNLRFRPGKPDAGLKGWSAGGVLSTSARTRTGNSTEKANHMAIVLQVLNYGFSGGRSRLSPVRAQTGGGAGHFLESGPSEPPENMCSTPAVTARPSPSSTPRTCTSRAAPPSLPPTVQYPYYPVQHPLYPV